MQTRFLHVTARLFVETYFQKFLSRKGRQTKTRTARQKTVVIAASHYAQKKAPQSEALLREAHLTKTTAKSSTQARRRAKRLRFRPQKPRRALFCCRFSCTLPWQKSPVQRRTRPRQYLSRLRPRRSCRWRWWNIQSLPERRERLIVHGLHRDRGCLFLIVRDVIGIVGEREG